jgi:hypothetical protein
VSDPDRSAQFIRDMKAMHDEWLASDSEAERRMLSDKMATYWATHARGGQPEPFDVKAAAAGDRE